MNRTNSALKKFFWSVASGKGGTGKSAISTNLGIAISLLGYRVLLIDADMGGANLHLNLHMENPGVTLNDFILKRKNKLSEVTLDTPCENLKLISGGSGLVGIANLPYQTKRKLIRHFNKLEYDYIFVDLAGGTTFNTVDFFNMSEEGIIIMNPEPTSRNNAFAFLKNVVFRRTMPKLKKAMKDEALFRKFIAYWKSKGFNMNKLINVLKKNDPASAKLLKQLLNSFQPKLIINKKRRGFNEKEEDLLMTLSKDLLGINIELLGLINNDERVMDASEKSMPFLIEYPSCRASKDIYKIIYKMNVKNPDYSNRRFIKIFEERMKGEKKKWLSYYEEIRE